MCPLILLMRFAYRARRLADDTSEGTVEGGLGMITDAGGDLRQCVITVQ